MNCPQREQEESAEPQPGPVIQPAEPAPAQPEPTDQPAAAAEPAEPLPTQPAEPAPARPAPADQPAAAEPEPVTRPPTTEPAAAEPEPVARPPTTEPVPAQPEPEEPEPANAAAIAAAALAQVRLLAAGSGPTDVMQPLTTRQSTPIPTHAPQIPAGLMNVLQQFGVAAPRQPLPVQLQPPATAPAQQPPAPTQANNINTIYTTYVVFGGK